MKVLDLTVNDVVPATLNRPVIVGGTATAGDCGTATTGIGWHLVLRWWNSGKSRYALTVGYVGGRYRTRRRLPERAW